MAFLIVTSGNMKGQRFGIDRDKVDIGRAPDNVISIDDPAVSARHCCVLRHGRRYTIRDLDSTNGTTLNNTPTKEARLKPKDTITIGSAEIIFDGDDVEAEETPPSTASGMRPAEKPPSPVRSPGIGRSPFGARHSARGIWIAVFVLLVLVLAAVGYWFLSALFKS